MSKRPDPSLPDPETDPGRGYDAESGTDRRELLAGGLAASWVLAVDGRRFLGPGEPVEPGGPAPADPAPPAELRRLPREEPHMRREEREVDVFVAGGGLAGVCAALAAARNGARVVLVQDRSRLGGNGSSEIRMHVVGADCHGSRSGWREGGLIEEIRLEDAVRNPHSAWELFDLTPVRPGGDGEEGLELTVRHRDLFAADVEDGDRDRRGLRPLRQDRDDPPHQSEARIAIATGDGRLALEAGAEFRTGREPRAEFDEPLALEKGDSTSRRARASCSRRASTTARSPSRRRRGRGRSPRTTCCFARSRAGATSTDSGGSSSAARET